MNSFITTIALFFVVQASFAQINMRNVAQVNVQDAKQLTTVVNHSMGDVNVRGYDGENIFAYSQESLPSLQDLKHSSSDEIFKQLTAADFKQREIQLRKVPEFNIERINDIVHIKTNVYSFNTNIHVLTPYKSNVAVDIKDMGDISVENVHGHVEANTTSGDINIKDAEGIINANTQNGSIVSKFRQDRKNPLFVSTFVGNIEIIVPKTTSNSVLASSEMGNLYSNFERGESLSVNASSQHVKNRKINFNINKGGTEFVIYTFKGDIYLRYLE